MQHDLIGFLIDALESSERERIEEQLTTDEGLRRELEVARLSLFRLNWDAEPFPAPVGLAERTCAFVAKSSRGSGPGGFTTLGGFSSDLSARSSGGVCLESPVAESNGWTFSDFVVAAGICVAAACLFFPAILNSRYNAQLVFCQNNLRQLGAALQQYSDQNNGYFPVVPATGKMAFAGAYAPMLMDVGLIDADHAQILHCPSRGRTFVIRLAPSKDVNEAQGATLTMLQETMGGDYAYSLGFVQDGKLRGIRRNKNQQRAQYVILADAPLGRDFRGVHGRGQNLLFEDGRAAFLASRKRPGARSDDFFVNDKGYVEAGVHSEDCVLGSSPTPPLIFIRQ